MKQIQRMFTLAYVILLGFPVFMVLGALKAEFVYFHISIAIAIPGLTLFFIALYKRNKFERETTEAYGLIEKIGTN